MTAKPIIRRTATRDPLKRFYLVCEGRNTEPRYFEALVDHFGRASVNVIALPGVGAPQTIVQAAVKISKGLDRKYSFEKADEVWAIFDCDHHDHYELARRECREKGMNLAYSDPCFELWLILHHELYEKSEGHVVVQRRYAELDPAYSARRGKVCDFSLLSGRIEAAEENAAQQQINRLNEGHAAGRPSTTVHLLTRKLRGL